VYLGGWYLTDDRDNLKKWPLPPSNMRAGARLVFFASGVQIEDHPENSPYYDGAHYHTNFQLDGQGEYLALVDPHGYIIHEYQSHEYAFGEFGYPPQRQEVYDGEEQYFPTPTLGTANVPGYEEISSVPYFSRPAGTFVESFNLSLTTAVSGAQIRYTTDGTMPTASSTLYTAAIPITSTTEVMARLYEPGKAPGPFVTRTYVAIGNDASHFDSEIPIVVVDTHGQGINQNAYTRCSAVFIERPISGERTRITHLPDHAGRCGIRIRGSSTGGAAKHQYSFETWDEHDDDTSVSLLGLPSDSDWVLYGPYQYDRALINNALAYELSRQVGRYACRTRACEMYLNTGGGKVTQSDFVGFYYVMEKIRVNKDRVDVGRLEPWDTTEPRVTGGYIVAIDRADPDGPGFSTSHINRVNYVDPKVTQATTTQKNWIRSYFNQIEAVLYNNSIFDHPVNGYAKYIDVASHIDHSLLNLLPLNVDAFRLSGYMAKHRGGKLHAGPIWDFDRAFESADSRDDNPRSWNGSANPSFFFSYIWYGRFHQDIDFWQRYIDRWYELRNSHFSDAALEKTIDELADEVTAEAAARNYARWPGRGSRFGDFQGEIEHMKDWLFSRTDWIDQQFVRPPQMTPDGGCVSAGTVVTLTNLNRTGEIYYTLDGSDPRTFRTASGGLPGRSGAIHTARGADWRAFRSALVLSPRASELPRSCTIPKTRATPRIPTRNSSS